MSPTTDFARTPPLRCARHAEEPKSPRLGRVLVPSRQSAAGRSAPQSRDPCKGLERLTFSKPQSRNAVARVDSGDAGLPRTPNQPELGKQLESPHTEQPDQGRRHDHHRRHAVGRAERVGRSRRRSPCLLRAPPQGRAAPPAGKLISGLASTLG